MKLSRPLNYAIGCLLAASGLVLWWLKSGDSFTGSSGRAEDGMTGTVQRRELPENPITACLNRLGSKPKAADAVGFLSTLRANLVTIPREEAVAWIREFLDSGLDRETGLSFEIAKGGALGQAPSLRVFLLDLVSEIDRVTAAEISRGILANPTTSDEWALALRNVGRVETTKEANAFLRERTETLIANPAWQADPSIGYLNAFDVLVHTDASESTPLLSSLIQRKDRKDLAHAGFLTLDRLVQRRPLDVLARLAADRALQQSRPEMTAQEFARADLRDPAQQSIVKSWLLDPARSATELHSFAGTYPNSNHFVSNNLLTIEPQASAADLAEHDRQALGILTSWSQDPAFQSVKDHLRAMVSRLQSFVNGDNAQPGSNR